MKTRNLVVCLVLACGCGLDVVGGLPAQDAPLIDGGVPSEEAGATDASSDVAEDGKPVTGYRVIGLGSGRDGQLTATAADTIVNSYAAITGNVAAGATVIPVGPVAPAGTRAP